MCDKHIQIVVNNCCLYNISKWQRTSIYQLWPIQKEKWKIIKNKRNGFQKQDERIAKNAGHPTGPNNMNVSQGEKCIKCGKLGYYANCCRSARTRNRIADEEADSADEDNSIPDRIHSIQQKIHSTGTKNKNGPSVYTKMLLVNNRPIKFIVDTGAPVTLIPKTKFTKTTTTKIVEVYRDVNDNTKKFQGETIAKFETDGRVRQLELLITTKPTHSILGLNWMEKMRITEAPLQTINHIDQSNQTIDKPDADITTLKSIFHKLFTKNHTIKNREVDIQLEGGAKIIQQKSRPSFTKIPIHLQPTVEKKSKK